MVGLVGDLPCLDFPLWLHVSEQLGTVASDCTLPHSAFLGAGGENAQEAAASSELPERKVGDIDHANFRV